MKPCPHFEIWRKRIPRRGSSPEESESFHEIKVPYCTHARSPTPLAAAQQGLGGGGSVLECGGHVRRCPLPEGVRPEPEARPRMLSARALEQLEEARLTGTGGRGGK